MRIKVVHDLQCGQTWVVRLIETGDGYGLNDQVVHPAVEPLVEFFDPRYPHTDLGQFVACYGMTTLLNRPESSGLCLDMGSPSWTVSSSCMQQVHQWLQLQAAARA